MKNDQVFLIALGANLPSAAGPPLRTLHAALAALAAAGVAVEAASRFYATPCFPPGAGPDYVNAAARLRFAGSPAALMALLHEVEARFGRERVQRWGRRTLDLDLVAAGDTVLPDADTQAAWRLLSAECQKARSPGQLILPHPRLQDRAFVLVPLADVAPEWRHPLLGVTVRQMLMALPGGAVAEIVPI